MGLSAPKALLKMQGEATFLSSVIESVSSLNDTFNGLHVPLVMMNSFATHEATIAACNNMAIPSNVKITHFVQRKFPRLSPSTLRPAPAAPTSSNGEWDMCVCVCVNSFSSHTINTTQPTTSHPPFLKRKLVPTWSWWLLRDDCSLRGGWDPHQGW